MPAPEDSFLNRLLKKLPCLAILFLLMVLSLAPLHGSIFNAARPMLILTGVFYWSLFRPGFLNIFGLFAIGIFYDSFAQIPLGLTSLILIGTHLSLQSQRRILLHQPFWLLWMVFSVLALLAGFFTCLANMLLGLSFVPVLPYLLDVIVSVALFPFVVILLKITNPPLDQHLGRTK